MKLNRKVSLGCSYVGFFFVAFLLFFYWTFPYERVAAYAEQQVTGAYELEIGDLEPSWLTGVEASGVRLAAVDDSPEAPAEDSEEEREPPAEVVFDELEVRVSLLSLMSGDIGVSFGGEVGGGTFEGEYEGTESKTHIQLELDSINLRQLGILREFTQLGLGGIVTGKIDVTIAEQAEETQGSITLSVQGLQIGPGKLRFDHPLARSGLSIERARAGDLELTIEFENGSGTVETLQAQGEDLSIEGSGSLRPRFPIETSHIALNLQLEVMEAYREGNDRMSALFAIMEQIPQLQRARTGDGAYAFQITGLISEPRLRPGGRGRGR